MGLLDLLLGRQSVDDIKEEETKKKLKKAIDEVKEKAEDVAEAADRSVVLMKVTKALAKKNGAGT